MPKRTNQFQREVLALTSQMANEAKVAESSLLTDLLTGGSREVDITVDGSVAGHPIRIGIESRAVRRRADVTWVEQMKAKHERLPTNLLVLVSRSGFTVEAKRVAALAKIVTWTSEEMQRAFQRPAINNVIGALSSSGRNSLVSREYAFMPVSELVGAYKTVLGPMLQDRGLSDQSTLGVLLCTRNSSSGQPDLEVQWTTFVDNKWLDWFVQGHQSGYGLLADVPPDKIHGQIPAWPDSFFELLQAMVITETTLHWQRHDDGYLVLSQQTGRQTKATAQ
jgi:hypothetical protein